MAKDLIIKTLNTLVVSALTLLAGVTLKIEGCSRTPIELKNVGIGDNDYEGLEAICTFYDSDGNKTPVINRDLNFNQKGAYDVKGPRLQGNYNVSAYQDSFLGLKDTVIATNIVYTGINPRN